MSAFSNFKKLGVNPSLLSIQIYKTQYHESAEEKLLAARSDVNPNDAHLTAMLLDVDFKSFIDNIIIPMNDMYDRDFIDEDLAEVLVKNIMQFLGNKTIIIKEQILRVYKKFGRVKKFVMQEDEPISPTLLEIEDQEPSEFLRRGKRVKLIFWMKNQEL